MCQGSLLLEPQRKRLWKDGLESRLQTTIQLEFPTGWSQKESKRSTNCDTVTINHAKIHMLQQEPFQLRSFIARANGSSQLMQSRGLSSRFLELPVPPATWTPRYLQASLSTSHWELKVLEMLVAWDPGTWWWPDDDKRQRQLQVKNWPQTCPQKPSRKPWNI